MEIQNTIEADKKAITAQKRFETTQRKQRERLAQAEIDYREQIARLSSLIAENLISRFLFCSEILPYSYRYIKTVPWFEGEKNESGEIVVSAYFAPAKKGAHGRGTRFLCFALDDESVLELKGRGWKLISKEYRKLVK